MKSLILKSNLFIWSSIYFPFVFYCSGFTKALASSGNAFANGATNRFITQANFDFITNNGYALGVWANSYASIANANLANDGITIDGADISLGGSVTTLQLGTSSSTALAGDTTTISGAQASAITANTAKTGITSGQASAITANTAKISFDSASSTKLGTIEEGEEVIKIIENKILNKVNCKLI